MNLKTIFPKIILIFNKKPFGYLVSADSNKQEFQRQLGGFGSPAILLIVLAELVGKSCSK
jgi:hypothetical protein